MTETQIVDRVGAFLAGAIVALLLIVTASQIGQYIGRHQAMPRISCQNDPCCPPETPSVDYCTPDQWARWLQVPEVRH